jgi:D-sedoheptulose 7-phosphate isomerase
VNDESEPLNQLYPFLHGNKQNPQQLREALLESTRQKYCHSIDVKQQFFNHNSEALVDTATALAQVYNHHGRLFTMGNGGSSCDASHLAVEFQHPVTAGRPSLPAMNLSMDMAMISAVANDVGIEHVFARQVEAHASSGDALVGFSTSGNSKNLMAAFAKARDIGLTTIGFCGGDGGDMRASGLLDHCLWVECDSIHRVQEVHVAIYHILWDLTHTLLADERGNLA